MAAAGESLRNCLLRETGLNEGFLDIVVLRSVFDGDALPDLSTSLPASVGVAVDVEVCLRSDPSALHTPPGPPQRTPAVDVAVAVVASGFELLEAVDEASRFAKVSPDTAGVS